MSAFVLSALLTSPAVRAAESPFLVAARERESRAKAFEVRWRYDEEFRGWDLNSPSGEPVDFARTGRGELSADGDRWQFQTGIETTTYGLAGLRLEAAFDGLRTLSRFRTPVRPGEFQTEQLVHTRSSPIGWPEYTAPVRWVFRGSQPESILVPQPYWTPWEKVNGPVTTLGGRPCVEYHCFWRSGHPAPQRLWVCPDLDNLPVRYEDHRSRVIQIDYRPHPGLGWVPTGWTETSGRPPLRRLKHTRVTVDGVELPDSIPAERFTVRFPVGSQVRQVTERPDAPPQNVELVVHPDGSLVNADAAPERPPDRPEPPSLHRALWVVGVAVAGFIGFVVLVKWLSRRPCDPIPSNQLD